MNLENIVSIDEVKKEIDIQPTDYTINGKYNVILIEETPFRQSGTSIKYWM